VTVTDLAHDDPSLPERVEPKRSGGVLRRVLLVGMGLMLGLVFAEIALRIASPVKANDLLPLPYDRSGLDRIAAGETYIAFDQLLGWSIAPSMVGVAPKATYRANAEGLRASREYSQTPPETGPRLAAFGDSFTHCDDVENNECWTAQLEASTPGLEVMNFGVSGFAPDQAWLRYQRDGKAYQPCAVLIGYMVENVNRVVNRFRPFYQPDTGITMGKPRYIVRNGELELIPSPAQKATDYSDIGWVERAYGPDDFWYSPGMFAGDLLDLSQFVRLARTAAYDKKYSELRDDNEEARDIAWAYQPNSEGLDVAARVLTSFAQQVQADGSTPVVLIFGRKSDVIAMRHGEKKVYDPLLDRLEGAGVTTIDLTDGLYRASRDGGVERLIDKHYRARGNQVVADTLAKRLPDVTSSTCRWP
jgi:hypothetical protein